MRHGFSLVELSIVLVILGLLVGGVLAGQSLIQAAEIRKMMRQFETYEAAIHSFKDKYLALPGDMANATSFWGDDSGDNACVDPTIPNGNPGTCNGDGNNIVLNYNQNNNVEMYRVWEHLSLAGMIEGGYTYNYFDGVTETQAPGTVIPKTYRDAAVKFETVAGIYGASGSNHYLSTGKYSPASTNYRRGHLSSAKAYSIDAKYDDGKPGLGKIIVLQTEWSWCPSDPDNCQPCTGRFMFTGPASTVGYYAGMTEAGPDACKLHIKY